MNRRAKRNKFKKLQRELERRIEAFDARSRLEHLFSKETKVRQLSAFRQMDSDLENCVLPRNMVKRDYREDVARQMADEILKNPKFLKITDTGYGYRYDLLVVEQ